jgi:hypothetical protein
MWSGNGGFPTKRIGGGQGARKLRKQDALYVDRGRRGGEANRKSRRVGSQSRRGEWTEKSGHPSDRRSDDRSEGHVGEPQLRGTKPRRAEGGGRKGRKGTRVDRWHRRFRLGRIIGGRSTFMCQAIRRRSRRPGWEEGRMGGGERRAGANQGSGRGAIGGRGASGMAQVFR